MSTKLKHQDQQPKENASGGGNVLPLSKCSCEGCSKKSELMSFCNEHYDWFKFGLLTKEGKRPSDFDKNSRRIPKREPLNFSIVGNLPTEECAGKSASREFHAGERILLFKAHQWSSREARLWAVVITTQVESSFVAHDQTTHDSASLELRNSR